MMKRKMKRYNGEEGSQVEVDPMEAANASDEAMDIAQSVGTGARNMDTPKPRSRPKPKAAPKAAQSAAKTESTPAPKAAPVDETKLSLSDRMKLSRDRARTGSKTDNRSVNQRFRDMFGMKEGGMTASKRADGIASRGKTKCKMY
jgi:hypothetical protein